MILSRLRARGRLTMSSICPPPSVEGWMIEWHLPRSTRGGWDVPYAPIETVAFIRLPDTLNSAFVLS